MCDATDLVRVGDSTQLSSNVESTVSDPSPSCNGNVPHILEANLYLLWYGAQTPCNARTADRLKLDGDL